MDAQQEYDRIVAILCTHDNVAPTKMFGMPTISLAGKAFAGLRGEGMVFKLDGEAHGEALAVPGAHLFDPSGGRPMKEWIVIPLAESAHWERAAVAAHRSMRARLGLD